MTDSIVFEAYEGPQDLVGTASVHLAPLRAAGGDIPDAVALLSPLAAAGRGVFFGSGAVSLAPPSAYGGVGEAFGRVLLAPLRVAGAPADIAPTVSLGVSFLSPLSVSAQGLLIKVGSASSGLAPLRAYGAPDAAFGRVLLAPPAALGYMAPPAPTTYLSMLMSPGYMAATLSAPTVRERLVGSVLVGDGAHGQAIHVLGDGLALDDDVGTLLQALGRLADGTGLGDVLAVVWRELLADGAALGEDVTPSRVLIGELVESIRLVGGVGSTLSALNVVIAALALADAMAVVARESLGEGLVLGDDYATALQAYERVVVGALLGDVLGGSAVFAALIEEQVGVAAALSSTAELLVRLRSGLELGLTLRIGDTTFFAWVCHPESQAFTSYTNYPFNSFAKLGSRIFGVASDGLYELTGDSDDGEPIAARFRTGLVDLGTRRLKRMESMYLAFTTSGRLLLKVTTTSEAGEKVEYHYELVPRTANVVREGRIKIGRGLKSVFWAFEVANVDGADFAADTLETLPLILDRRI